MNLTEPGDFSELLACAEHVVRTWHLPLPTTIPAVDAALAGTADDDVLAAFRRLAASLEAHIGREEGGLFPFLAELHGLSGVEGLAVEGPLARMAAEHEDLERVASWLRAELRRAGEGRGPLERFLDDFSAHSGYEDTVLFPAARRLVQQRVSAEARHVVDAPASTLRLDPTPARRGLRSRLRSLFRGQ